MGATYLRNIVGRNSQTPQNVAIPGENMIKNAAGGYTYEVDKWARLERFLILGSEGGTYYVGQHEFTLDNAINVIDCVKEDGKRVVDIVVDISDKGRAVSNNPALFVLAICVAYGSLDTKQYVRKNFNKVVRIGTHLLTFVDYITNIYGKWGANLRKTISNWFTSKSVDALGFQAVKYFNRNGWTMRDVLRLSHPRPTSNAMNNLFAWICDKKYDENLLPDVVLGKIKTHSLDRSDIKQVIDYINTYNLPREALPTIFLNDANVWRQLLLKNMPIMAMIRNLGKMSALNILNEFSEEEQHIVNTLTNKKIITKSRIHPFAILIAYLQYDRGTGFRGNLSWKVNQRILQALHEAYMLAFDNVVPTGKRFLVALDVSGSMTDNIGSIPLTSIEAETAIALVLLNTEENVIVKKFHHEFMDANINKHNSIRDAIRTVYDGYFGATDCALPMIWALKNKIPVDVFVIITDNETWIGDIHPVEALRNYRNAINKDAKLCVVATVSSNNTIADPNDLNTLDIVGMDTTVPQAISEFSAA